MLNEQKIKKMRKLATYESGKGRKQLRISKYYRSDYIGLSLIKNFFLTTFVHDITETFSIIEHNLIFGLIQ